MHRAQRGRRGTLDQLNQGRSQRGTTVLARSLDSLMGDQRPATFLMKMAISSFSMVPEPSLSNSLKQASKSVSLNSPESFISERVFWTNFLVSSLSREPELSLSYSAQMSSTHFLITASMSAI